MSYIGNTSTTQAFTPAIDYFSGNGSTTAFTLSRPVASVAQIQVVVNNVAQNPSSAYTVSGNTITFTSAPSSGTNNIYVYYTSPITQVGTLTQNPVITGNLNFGSTGARITGDFSNATLANRVAFQSSTTNGATVVTAIPNGNSTQSFFAVHNSSDITNSSLGYIAATGLDTRIVSASTGTGTNLPLTFFTGGSERMRINSSGNVGIGTSSPASRIHASYAGAVNTNTFNVSTISDTTTPRTLIGANLVLSDDGTTYTKPATSISGAGILFESINSLNAHGSIQFLSAPDTNSSSATPVERMRIDSSGNLQFNNGYGSVATAYGCRAWVNFNGTGTVAIRASGNVTSITDNGVGDYTVNFTNAMPDANYSWALACNGNAGGMQLGAQLSGTATSPTLLSTSQIRFNTGATSGGTNIDMFNVSAIFFR